MSVTVKTISRTPAPFGDVGSRVTHDEADRFEIDQDRTLWVFANRRTVAAHAADTWLYAVIEAEPAEA